MKPMSTRRTLWTIAATVFLVGSLALWAQDQPAPQGQGPSGGGKGPSGGGKRGGGPGGGGNFSPEQFQQRMMDGIHQRLGATDEEWKAIEPLLKDVMQKQSDARMADFGGIGRMMFGGGDRGGTGGGDRGGPGGRDQAQGQGQQGGQESQRGGPGGDRGRPDSGMSGRTQSPEVEALSKALEDTNAKPDDIKAKLDALRKARAAKEDALKQAREKLREVLTVKQEAQMVLMGTLD